MRNNSAEAASLYSRLIYLRPNLAAERKFVSRRRCCTSRSPAVGQNKSLFNRTVSTFSQARRTLSKKCLNSTRLGVGFEIQSSRRESGAICKFCPSAARRNFCCYYLYSSTRKDKSYIRAAAAAKHRLNFPAATWTNNLIGARVANLFRSCARISDMISKFNLIPVQITLNLFL